MTIRAIETPLQANIKAAKELLEEAAASEFESVIVFGFKDGRVHRRFSGGLNV